MSTHSICNHNLGFSGDTSKICMWNPGYSSYMYLESQPSTSCFSTEDNNIFIKFWNKKLKSISKRAGAIEI